MKLRLHLPQEVRLPLPFRKFLDGIPEHRARHVSVVFLKKCFERFHIPLPHLAQHPAHGLMNEIMRIVTELMRDREHIIEVLIADKPECGHDRDPSVPKVL